MNWISVSERLPDVVPDDFGIHSESAEVLVYRVCPVTGNGGIWIASYKVYPAEDKYGPKWIEKGIDGYDLEGITHWMPLPEPPKSDEQKFIDEGIAGIDEAFDESP